MALLAKQKRRIEDASPEVDLDAAWAEGQRAAQDRAEAVARAAENRAKFRKMKQDTPDIVYINGKRMRKKKKPPKEEPAPTKKEPAPPIKEPTPSKGEPALEDSDIFGEVGAWDGLSDTEPHPTITKSTSHDWFGTRAPSPEPPKQEQEEHRLQGLSTSALPSKWSRWLLERESQRAATSQP